MVDDEAEEEDAAAAAAAGGMVLASNGTVPYSLLHPGHWLRQCSLICCTQNRHTLYLQAHKGREGGVERGRSKLRHAHPGIPEYPLHRSRMSSNEHLPGALL